MAEHSYRPCKPCYYGLAVIRSILAFAPAHNRLLHRTFPERAIFRLANRLFKPVWNCQHIERVEIIEARPSLLIRDDEVEESWRIVNLILAEWSRGRVPLRAYPAGSAL